MKVNNPLIPKFPIKLNSLEEYNELIKRIIPLGFKWSRYYLDSDLNKWNPFNGQGYEEEIILNHIDECDKELYWYEDYEY